jgi:natural product precursor
MKKPSRKLTLNKQTIRVLDSQELANVAGGWIRPPISWTCPQPPPSSAHCPKL